MLLLIFESIGTSELILVGIVALIFLGPRKLPEMARKLGKIMTEFRGTANEFKETWQREVNFEEETKVFDINALESETVSRTEPPPEPQPADSPPEPVIREVDPARFEHLVPAETAPVQAAGEQPTQVAENDKQNWL